MSFSGYTIDIQYLDMRIKMKSQQDSTFEMKSILAKCSKGI